MKMKWLAMIGLASAGVLSSQATLKLDFTGLGSDDSLNGTRSALLEVTNITANAGTLGTNGLVNTVGLTVSAFQGSGTLGVSFLVGNAFDETTWTVTDNDNSILSSNNNDAGRKGIGSHDDEDGATVAKRRTLGGDEVLEFTIHTNAFTASGQLQFRVVFGSKNNSFSLFEQTGATSGALLQSMTASSGMVGNIGMTEWYDVDGLQTFAVQDNEGNLQALEFRVDSGTVLPPSSVSIISSNVLVKLDWSADTATELLNYKIYRSFTTNVLTGADFYASVTTNTFTDLSVTNDVTYYYAVTAVGSDSGETPLSSSTVVSATPIVPVPTGLKATAGNEKVRLNWDASNDYLFDSFNVYRSTSTNFTLLDSGITTNVYTDTTVVNGTTYYYKVSQWDDNDDESALSAQVQATPDSVVVISYVTGSVGAGGSTNQFQLTDLGSDPVTYTNLLGNNISKLGSPALFNAGSVPGAITMTGVAYTNADVSAWTFDGLGQIRRNNEGAGVEGGTRGFNPGEAILYSVSFDSTLQSWLDGNSGAVVQLVRLGATSGGLGVYTESGGSNAVATAASGMTIFSLPLTNGMEFAIASAGANNGYMPYFAFDIVPPTSGSYATFASQYGLVEGPEGDDDDDGLSNLGEYAINGNPTNSADKGQTSYSRNGSVFTYVYASNTVDSALIYRLIDTGNLVFGPFGTNNNTVAGVGPVVDDYARSPTPTT